MVKIVLRPVIIALVAAILSLSVFAYAYAAETEGGSGDAPKQNQKQQQPKPTNVRNFGNKGVQIGDFPSPNSNDKGTGDSGSGHHDNTGGGLHHKIKTIKGLFRGSSSDDGSSALANIPVIQPLTPAQINGINTTATVTIPVCDGIVPGPCLDKTTGQIVP